MHSATKVRKTIKKISSKYMKLKTFHEYLPDILHVKTLFVPIRYFLLLPNLFIHYQFQKKMLFFLFFIENLKRGKKQQRKKMCHSFSSQKLISFFNLFLSI
jgi:hypothetical protein